MSDAPTRPPFVLAFFADQQGCGSHRILFPAGALHVAGLIDARVDGSAWTAEQFSACAPDIMVWQRVIEETQLAALKTAREACPNTFFVYELDDPLDVVPERSYHAGYIPDSVNERVTQGLKLCDAASTTTETMATWLRQLGMKDVRVIPNLVPQMGVQSRKQHGEDRKLRIGWGGGISHAGDLDQIRPAMAELGDLVEWVFLAAKPDNPPVPVEFHDGVPPLHYLDKLRSLDLDLIIAPLEHNPFNAAKSNLRLVEAGAVGAAVIAQRFGPYLENDPPVVEHAMDESSWTSAIKRFVNLPEKERQRHADEMQRWVLNNYTFEARIKDRFQAWLPPGVPQWRPNPARQQLEPVVILAPGGAASLKLPRSLRNARVYDKAVDAANIARTLGADLLYLRPSVTLFDDAWDRIRQTLLQAEDIAAALPLAPDGPNAFPRLDTFIGLNVENSKVVNTLAAQHLLGRYLRVNILGGPAILLSRHALAMLGDPDFTGCGHPEEAILEWGLRATPRGWKFYQNAAAYVGALLPSVVSEHFQMRTQTRGLINFAAQCPTENLAPEDREKLELELLHRQWNRPGPGQMGFPNDYATWAQLKTDGVDWSPAAQPDMGLRLGARFYGEPADHLDWVILLDSNVTLKPYAFYCFGQAISKTHSSTDIVFADHEIKQGDALVPVFKPGFDAELLLAYDYVTPVCAVRVAGRYGSYTGSREDLTSELLFWTLEGGAGAEHVPQILGTVQREGTPEELALVALQHRIALESISPKNIEFEVHRHIPGTIIARRTIPDGSEKLVSIIMQTKGDGWLLQPAVSTILRLTTYANFEIIIVHTSATGEPDIGKSASDPRVRWVRWDKPYNWSAVNNFAVREHAKGDLLLFVNDDIRVVSQDWLTRMVGHALRPEVGAVGIRLLFPQGVVQHIGVVVRDGMCGHAHIGLPANHPGYWGVAALSHEASAVTGAALLTAADTFARMGEFDEDLPHEYNDVAYCLELRKAGKKIIVECSAELLHIAGATRTVAPAADYGQKLIKDRIAFSERFRDYVDPYWNPNFDFRMMPNWQMQGLNYDMLVWEDEPPHPKAKRVLLINDAGGFDGRAFDVVKRGDVAFQADLSTFTLRLITPLPANSHGWDIRQTSKLRAALLRLGIDGIIFRSLKGQHGLAPPIETLKALKALKMLVELDPADSEMQPWLTAVQWPEDSLLAHIDIDDWRNAYDQLAGGLVYLSDAEAA